MPVLSLQQNINHKNKINVFEVHLITPHQLTMKQNTQPSRQSMPDRNSAASIWSFVFADIKWLNRKLQFLRI